MNTYDLPMTVVGMRNLLHDQKFMAERGKPQVYIHVGTSDPLENQVIRIGRAENGTYERWRDKTGHYWTFLYAVGAEDGYCRPWKYPNYLGLFAGLHGLSTDLHVVTCRSSNHMKSLEKTLINDVYGPMWEQYRNVTLYRKKGYFADYPEVRDNFSTYGKALEMTTMARAGLGRLPKPLPELLDFRSLRQWNEEDFSVLREVVGHTQK